MRALLLVLLSGITLFALYSLTTHPNAFGIITLITDSIILIYIWKYLPRHLKHHEKNPSIF